MRFSIRTKGNNDIIDITDKVSQAAEKSKAKEGICVISSPGSTIGITTIENEPGLLEDFKEILEKLIPAKKDWRHNKTWGEENAQSHMRSSFIKPFLTVPIENGKLVLGTWQQIVFIDFDSRSREREILVKVIPMPT